MIELSLDHRWGWGLASIVPSELVEGKRIIYLSSQENRLVNEPIATMTGCKKANEYVEKFFAEIVSHETTHFAIYDAFKDNSTDRGIEVTRMLDNFDNWTLNPINFSELDPNHDKEVVE